MKNRIVEAAPPTLNPKKATRQPKKGATVNPAHLQPVAPAPPSPAVLKLQEQVVELVAHRNEARASLTAAHAEYLTAQARFQAAEANVRGTEQDAQYLLGLIAQLENRTPPTMNAPVLQMPSMGVVSSEPSSAPQPQAQQQRTYATASADDLKREMRGMM